MGLMSDEILGTAPEAPREHRPMNLRVPLRKPQNQAKKSYLKRKDVDKQSASEHRKTFILSSLSSALDQDDSSVGSFGLDSPPSSFHSRSSEACEMHSSGMLSMSSEESKRLKPKRRGPGKSPKALLRKRADIPPAPSGPQSAPQTSRKVIRSNRNRADRDKDSLSSTSDHGIDTRRRRQSLSIFGSSDSMGKSPKRGVSRSTSLLSRKSRAESFDSSQAPHAPSMDQKQVKSRKAPGRSVSLKSTLRRSNPSSNSSNNLGSLSSEHSRSGPTRKPPSRSVSQSSGTGRRTGSFIITMPSSDLKKPSLGAFFNDANKGRGKDESDDDSDDGASVASEQSWISWAASSALTTVEKLYDDLNGVDGKQSSTAKEEDDEGGNADGQAFPNTEAENFSTKLSTTDKLKGLRFVASKQKRRSLYV